MGYQRTAKLAWPTGIGLSGYLKASRPGHRASGLMLLKSVNTFKVSPATQCLITLLNSIGIVRVSKGDLNMHSLLHAAGYLISSLLTLIIANLLSQSLLHKKSEPPVIFHWLPFIGNAVSYGVNPHRFLASCREKHGDIFTFILLGRKMTCYLGLAGNEFILNGKHSHLNAEEIYSPLTTPVFGSDVVYDCPNAKLIEQKKFMKFGLTQQALERHVQLIEQEVEDYITTTPAFQGSEGTVDISSALAEITLFTAGRALQGKEVRQKLRREFAALYHDLDLGFQPINFLLPWAPLPHNRRRDRAHAQMRAIYEGIIQERRQSSSTDDSEHDSKHDFDMIANLMQCSYKDGRAVPDKEIAHMMITLLMAGQHSSSSTSAYILLRLASQPDVTEQLYREQMQNLAGEDDGRLPPLQFCDLDKLPLLQGVVKETLRVHSSITSVMRKVTKPLPIPGTPYLVTTDKVLMASPIITAMSDEFFKDAETWNPHRWLSRPGDANDNDDNDGDNTDIVDYGYGAVSKGTKSPYLPFGAGRHRCIGEKFAYMNLGVIVATLVRHYKVFTLDGKRHVPETDYTSLFAMPKKPARIRWERREA
ncbi:cytochrome P450 51A [Massariosphaeria phaeospora]|uniref:Cytochrome P450 51A n=1 Tax=Massariosphaeria phaeospora TaxID=100035 RepID=A0A7C8I6K1_9PLEO|nr:cytochrome P450 51A [Massariosphaeria phaeospora]